MTNLNQHELLEIYGGFSLTSAVVNSLVRAANSLLELGRSLGSAIRRVADKKVCPL